MHELMSSFWNATETWDAVGCSVRRAVQMFKSCEGVVWLVLKALISCSNNWGSLKTLLWSGGVGFTTSRVSTWSAGCKTLYTFRFELVLLHCRVFLLCVLLPFRWAGEGMMTTWQFHCDFQCRGGRSVSVSGFKLAQWNATLDVCARTCVCIYIFWRLSNFLLA